MTITFAVTGASGFVGKALTQEIANRGLVCRVLLRDKLRDPVDLLLGVDVLIHLAAVAHTQGAATDDYYLINRDLPVALASAAAQARVGRFVFVSSTHAVTHPNTPYGGAKAAAEVALTSITDIDMRIVRPPLVYGPGAKANMGQLATLCRTGLPLPFGAEVAPRSLIYIENLVDALLFVAQATELSQRIYTVTDPQPASLRMIVEEFRAARGRPARLFAAPWLRPLLITIKGEDFASKLLDGEVFDDRALREDGWNAPYQTRNALRRSAT